MIVKIIITLTFFLFITSGLFAQVAVLPYKINNPSKLFPDKTGAEYAKLIATTAICSKNIEIMSPRIISTELKRLHIDPEFITQQDLERFSRSNQVDFILYGKISKVKNKYLVKSIVYSTNDRAITLKISDNAYSLFDLARKEIKQSMQNYQNKKISINRSGLDTVFLIDTSYKTNRDWSDVQDSILDYTSNVVDRSRINAHIYIIPYGKIKSNTTHFYSSNSIISVKNALKKIKPRGSASPETFLTALRHAVKNIRWRQKSNKTIIIISNTNLNNIKGAEGYALYAKRKGITIHTLALGMISKGQTADLKRLSEITNGSHHYTAYYQKVFNAKGKAIDLFMENGRLFKAFSYENNWNQGLFIRDNRSSLSEKPKPYLSEIYIDDSETGTNPYQLPELYTKVSSKPLIKHGSLHNNITEIMNTIFENTTGPMPGTGSRLAKVLVTDNKISFWITVHNKKQLSFFQNHSQNNHMFPLGIIIRTNKSMSYGLEFTPIETIIPFEFIPDLAYAPLIDIIKNRHRYMTQGILYPPIWFIKVRVKRLQVIKSKKDILDF